MSKPQKGTAQCVSCRSPGSVQRKIVDGVAIFRPPRHWYMTMVPAVQNGQPNLVVVMICDRCVATGRVKFQMTEAPQAVPAPAEKPLVALR
jgi:hypothetical protein